MTTTTVNPDVRISIGQAQLAATVGTPEKPRGVVIFAHGSGSSRHSPRNILVAARLNDAGYQTVLLDLLTEEEERLDISSGEWRFNIELLSQRLVAACDWVAQDASKVGLFGASTGAAAALQAAAARPELVAAVVSRGGRPDLAGVFEVPDLPPGIAEKSGPALASVKAPTLLIVGGDDDPVIELNEEAAAVLGPVAKLVIIPGASHLFTEPGTLEQVAELAVSWFDEHLGGDRP